MRHHIRLTAVDCHRQFPFCPTSKLCSSSISSMNHINIIDKNLVLCLPGDLWACTATSLPVRWYSVPIRSRRLLCGRPIRRESRQCCRTRPWPRNSVHSKKHSKKREKHVINILWLFFQQEEIQIKIFKKYFYEKEKYKKKTTEQSSRRKDANRK